MNVKLRLIYNKWELIIKTCTILFLIVCFHYIRLDIYQIYIIDGDGVYYIYIYIVCRESMHVIN